MFIKLKKRLSIFISIVMLCNIIAAILFEHKAQAEEMLKVGDYIEFGKYNGEPILWKVLDQNDKGFLIHSVRIISMKPFDAAESGHYNQDDGNYQNDNEKAVQKWGSNRWMNSNIREWLNSDSQIVKYSTEPPANDAVYQGWNDYDKEPGFLSNFNDNEKSAINEVVNETEMFDLKTGKINGKDESKDKVFLLSTEEMEKYYGHYDDRLVEVTKEAAIKSAREYGKTDYTYKPLNKREQWLRTPLEDAYTVNEIYNHGLNMYASNGQNGVCPAIYLKPMNVEYGKGTEWEPYVVEKEKDQSGKFKPTYVSILSQKETNINCMLNARLNGITYWDYYANSSIYPNYIYLDEYFKSKSSWPIIGKMVGKVRSYTDPMVIILADKIYNDKAFKDQSTERAKEILVKISKESEKDITNFQVIKNGQKILSIFTASYEFRKIISKSNINNAYIKEEQLIEKLKNYLENKARAGYVISPSVLLKAKEFKMFSEFEKMQLIDKLQKEIMRLKPIDELLIKAGVGMNIISGLKMSYDEYVQFQDVLQANDNFIDFLTMIETKSINKSIRNAAIELKDAHNNRVKAMLNCIKDGVEGGLEDYIKGLSWQVSICQLGMNYGLGVGNRIEKFDRLKLTLEVSLLLDKEMTGYINRYKQSNSKIERDDAVDSIYKYAPYIFALRNEGETTIGEYWIAVGVDKKIVKGIIDQDKYMISKVKAMCYKDISPKTILNERIIS